MVRQRSILNIFLGGLVTLGVFWASHAVAQTSTPSPTAMNFFQGRGVAQGAVFTQGRNAHVALTLDRDNFSLELTEPQATGTRNQPPARLQYRGVINRRTNEDSRTNSFTLSTRVRSFDSSETLRVLTNTTGTCRIEVFDARVISSDCNTVAANSSTQFLGLEQF